MTLQRIYIVDIAQNRKKECELLTILKRITNTLTKKRH